MSDIDEFEDAITQEVVSFSTYEDAVLELRRRLLPHQSVLLHAEDCERANDGTECSCTPLLIEAIGRQE